jgi:hypothetical protein
LAKSTAHVITLFALSYLWLARKKLMAMTGQVRLQTARGALDRARPHRLGASGGAIHHHAHHWSSSHANG